MAVNSERLLHVSYYGRPPYWIYSAVLNEGPRPPEFPLSRKDFRLSVFSFRHNPLRTFDNGKEVRFSACVVSCTSRSCISAWTQRLTGEQKRCAPLLPKCCTNRVQERR